MFSQMREDIASVFARGGMYQPPQFRTDDVRLAAAVMREHPFASLITLDDEGFPFVSHLPLHLEEAEELCDRIAIINHGQLIANKPTRELVEMAREKVVVVTLDKPVGDCPSHPAFHKCEKTGEATLEITYDKDRSNAGEVLAAVQAQGFAIVDVTTREADLEDAQVRDHRPVRRARVPGRTGHEVSRFLKKSSRTLDS